MKYLTERHRSKSGEDTLVLMLPDFPSLDLHAVVEEMRALCNELRLYARTVVKEKPSFENLFLWKEEMDDRIAQISTPLYNLHHSMRTPEVEAAHREVADMLSHSNIEWYTNEALFRAYRSFRQTHAYRDLGEEEKAAFESHFQHFRYYGVQFDKRKRNRLRKLGDEIEKLSVTIGANIGASLNVPICFVKDELKLSGIPERVRVMMKQSAESMGKEGWAVLAKSSIRLAITRYADDRRLRERVFKAYATAASDIGRGGIALDNRPLIERMLLLEHRAAIAVGSRNHAERVTGGLMTGSPKKVFAFLNALHQPICGHAKREFAKLQKFAKAEFGYELQPWDIEYVKYHYLKKAHGFTREDLLPYLPVDRVLKALFDLAHKMYGIHIKERFGVSAWLPHVRFFEVYDEGGDLKGGFYLDLYARTGGVIKDESLWQQTLLNRRKIGKNEIRLPIAVIHLNLPTPKGKSLGHFTHEEMTGLFHEFGHMLHEVLSVSNYLGTCPGNIEWDTIEIPSTLLEHWAWDIEVLADITRRAKKEPVPFLLLLAIHRQRSLIESFGPWSLLEYYERALVDYYLHTEKPKPGYVAKIVARVREEVGILPTFALNRFPNNFPHYFPDYGASFYGYLLSKKFSAAIRLEHVRTMYSVSPTHGMRFRRDFIEGARTKSAQANLTAFFGRKLPSARALLELMRMV